METFVNEIRSTGWNKVGIEQTINRWKKKIKLQDVKLFLDSEFGIQRFYRTKKENLRIISYLTLKGTTSCNTKTFVYENLLYAEEVEELKVYYTRYKYLSDKRKRVLKKMMEEIAKDSYKRDLDEILKICGCPFSFRLKLKLLDFILLSIFLKPPSSVFVFRDSGEEEDCPICTEQVVQKGVTIKDCSCKMVYHKECIEKWLQLNNSCPSCRLKIAC